jgi:phosphoribosylformylglycinamidine cyclo-ligase
MREVDIKGMAHITGGGLTENIHRMFPPSVAARVELSRWPRPAIFDWLQRAGNVSETEMHRVFNCGIGMVLVVAARDADRTMSLLTDAGEHVFRIGGTVARAAGAPGTVVV